MGQQLKFICEFDVHLSSNDIRSVVLRIGKVSDYY